MKSHYGWFNIPTPNIKRNFKNFGFTVSPTFTSDEFEIAIERFTLPNGTDSLNLRDTIKILIKDNNGGDLYPEAGNIWHYVFDENSTSNFSGIEIEKEDSNDVRVVAYNIYMNGESWHNSSRRHNIESIFKSLDGEVYAIQEASSTSIAVAKSIMDTLIPLDSGWHAAKHDDMITLSRYPIIKNWEQSKKLYSLIDLPEKYRSDLLVVNAHFTWGNSSKQSQIDEFSKFILDMKGSSSYPEIQDNTPFLLCGDFNMTGNGDILTHLLNGEIQDTATYGQGGQLDWDHTSITNPIPFLTDRNMTYTWRWRYLTSYQYSPQRRDFHVYSDATMNVRKGFVLETETMDSTKLILNNLNKDDTEISSDHIPIIVDYIIALNDTSIIKDTIINIDTLIEKDTIINIDTICITRTILFTDSIFNTKTIINEDTTTFIDTISVIDTFWRYDTFYFSPPPADTIIYKDTIVNIDSITEREVIINRDSIRTTKIIVTKTIITTDSIFNIDTVKNGITITGCDTTRIIKTIVNYDTTYHNNVPTNYILGTNSFRVKIYPNPIKDKLHIESKDKIDRIRLWNIVGKIVFETNSNFELIQLEELDKGMYFLEIVSEKSQFYNIIKE